MTWLLFVVDFFSFPCIWMSRRGLLSCDDRLCRLARRHRRLLNVEVVNPLDWLKGIGDDLDS